MFDLNFIFHLLAARDSKAKLLEVEAAEGMSANTADQRWKHSHLHDIYMVTRSGRSACLQKRGRREPGRRKRRPPESDCVSGGKHRGSRFADCFGLVCSLLPSFPSINNHSSLPFQPLLCFPFKANLRKCERQHLTRALAFADCCPFFFTPPPICICSLPLFVCVCLNINQLPLGFPFPAASDACCLSEKHPRQQKEEKKP